MLTDPDSIIVLSMGTNIKGFPFLLSVYITLNYGFPGRLGQLNCMIPLHLN